MYRRGKFKSHNRPQVSLVVPKQKAVYTGPVLSYHILSDHLISRITEYTFRINYLWLISFSFYGTEIPYKGTVDTCYIIFLF